MQNRLFGLVILTAILVLGTGCSHQDPFDASDQGSNPYLRGKDGTEALGPPSIAIAAGSGLAEGGVGMVGVDTGQLDVDVPAGAQINQVLLYWAGASTDGNGDDTITLDGNPVTGDLIGGPTLFFSNYRFSAYRADITDLALVAPGSNTFEVGGFDFAVSPVDENNGASILVIYDEGPDTAFDLRDGLDMAFFGFAPTLDATVPQVFPVTPAGGERTADLLLIVASVGENRPNRVKVTTSAGDQFFDDVLGSVDGLTWDSVVLPVTLPAGDDEISVQIVSTDSQDPLGASLGWVAAGLSVEADLETFDVSGTVYIDADENQTQGVYELGIANVTVLLLDGDMQVVDSYVTGDDGTFAFAAAPGNYTVEIPLGATPEQFNYDIAQSFAPTSGLSLPVSAGSGSTGLEFGFVPRPGDILADLDTGVLLSNGQPLDYWLKVLRRTIIEEDSGRIANGHDDNDANHGQEAWGHPGWYPSPEQMEALIQEIETLFLPEPYQFTDGMEVEEVYTILRTKAKTDLQKLYQEMLVSELNYTAGLGLIGEQDRLAVLIAWGEALINLDPGTGAKSGEKDYKSDVKSAFQIFEAINTGGGGGVDE